MNKHTSGFSPALSLVTMMGISIPIVFIANILFPALFATIALPECWYQKATGRVELACWSADEGYAHSLEWVTFGAVKSPYRRPVAR